MSFKDKLYLKLPHYFQYLAFNAYSFNLARQREGAGLNSKLEFLKNHEGYNAQQLMDFQNQKLRRIIGHAFTTVPYYIDLAKREGIDWRKINKVEDLEVLPFLSKQDVKANFDKLLSKAYTNKDVVTGHTSGTTGSPLDVRWSRDMWKWSHAFDWRHKQWAGITPGSKGVILLGRTIVDPERSSPPFWMKDGVTNKLWISSFHLAPQYMDSIAGAIKKFQPEYIEGYPSTLSTLARLMKGREKLAVKATFTSSEPLYDYQLELIEGAFGCKNFDYYGLAEKTVWATECEFHTGLHVNTEFGVVEIVDSNLSSVSAEESGEIISTSLLNYAMPLIRYRTGDMSAFVSQECSCGRKYPLIEKIFTKSEDMIVTPDGRNISPSILTHPFKPLSSVTKSQIIQDGADSITVKLVCNGKFAVKDEIKLISEIDSRLGGSFRITIQHVDDIPQGPNGKYRWVINQWSKYRRLQ